MINEFETALYTTLTAASPGVSVFNTLSRGNPPYIVFEHITGAVDHASNRTADELSYAVKCIDDSMDGMNSVRTAASYADKVRTTLTGPDAINVTGSLSGYTCTGLWLVRPIKYIDGAGFWHAGDEFRFRISKAK